MMLETEMLDLSPSAKLVLWVLKEVKISDLGGLSRKTGLAKRTLMYSIEQLKKLGLVKTQICLKDSRRRYYCISINDM
jgi:DNA-binding MarR family transcriptional regulator